jgi:hypothetical protein
MEIVKLLQECKLCKTLLLAEVKNAVCFAGKAGSRPICPVLSSNRGIMRNEFIVEQIKMPFLVQTSWL